jgi:hypothetical protein
VAVPDLIGVSARSALRAAREADLRARLEGTGLVVFQHPVPPAIVRRGSMLRLVLASPLQSQSEETPPADPTGADNAEVVARAGGQEVNR